MLTCSFRTCDLETVDVLFPYLACVTVQQVFLDGKPVSEPVHSQALDSEPPSGDRLVPARTPAHRRRTAMPLDGKERRSWMPSPTQGDHQADGPRVHEE